LDAQRVLRTALSLAYRVGIKQIQNELVIILPVEVHGELLFGVGVAVLSLSCVNRELFSRSALAEIDRSLSRRSRRRATLLAEIQNDFLVPAAPEELVPEVPPKLMTISGTPEPVEGVPVDGGRKTGGSVGGPRKMGGPVGGA
jgi:hypothetical protein